MKIKDFIYERMKRDISEFYDKWYMGNKICMKNKHLAILNHHYIPGQFDGLIGKELRSAKEEFLTRIQMIVNLWSREYYDI